MTLFDDLKKVAVTELIVSSEDDSSVKAVTNKSNVVNNGEDDKEEIDFADAIGKLAAGSSEETAISGIMQLTRADEGETPDANLAMKAVVTHAGAFTAAQFMADYNDFLGMSMVSKALRALCKWQYTHNSALKGERAKAAFNALAQEEQKEFLLQKEAKGLLPH